MWQAIGITGDVTMTDIDGPFVAQTSKLHQSTRVVKIDVYYTIRPFKRLPVEALGGRVLVDLLPQPVHLQGWC